MSRRSVQPPAPEVCPVCGADVPARALACRSCGADHDTGWNEQAAAYDGVDLPDDDFDEDEYRRREFGSSARPAGVSWTVWLTSVVLIAGFIAMMVFSAS